MAAIFRNLYLRQNQAKMTHMLRKINSEDDVRLAEMRNDAKHKVYTYTVPDWAKNLKRQPSSKIDLCQKFTPVQRWRLPNIPEDFEIYIKRDDMTGSTVSGHKVRKLEFDFAEALEKDYKTVIGIGADVSNFCRIIAVVGKELGFHVHLVQYMIKEDLSLNYNISISRTTGAKIYPVLECDGSEVANKTLELATKLQDIEGKPAYILRTSSHDPGIYGYIEAFHELFLQGVTEEFTDLVVSCGSGITTSAFIIGNYLTGGKLRIHALSTNRRKNQCRRIICDILQNYGFLPQLVGNGVVVDDLVSIEDASREPKYGVCSDEILDFVRETAASTGIVLDPVYPGKTAYHMVKMIKSSPNRFRGKKILFFNSGSFIGLLGEDVLHNVGKEKR